MQCGTDRSYGAVATCLLLATMPAGNVRAARGGVLTLVSA
jgi:hypothetical protein